MSSTSDFISDLDEGVVLDSPPGYSSDTSLASTPVRVSYTLPGLPDIDFSRYKLKGARVTRGRGSTITTHPQYASDPKTLTELLHEQACLPPRLLVRIKGTHAEYGSTKNDFDFTVNLMSLLLRPATDRWNYMKVVTCGESGASDASVNISPDECAERFCGDAGGLKTFTLERKVTNFNTEFLEGRIRTAVASTKYEGHVEVTFPVAFSKVIIRASEEPRITFKDLWYWSMEPPAHPHLTKKYEVEAIWPYATARPGTADRQCAVMSEETWWYQWKDTVRNAVLLGKEGCLTVEDRIDVEMGLIVFDKQKSWGKSK